MPERGPFWWRHGVVLPTSQSQPRATTPVRHISRRHGVRQRRCRVSGLLVPSGQQPTDAPDGSGQGTRVRWSLSACRRSLRSAGPSSDLATVGRGESGSRLRAWCTNCRPTRRCRQPIAPFGRSKRIGGSVPARTLSSLRRHRQETTVRQTVVPLLLMRTPAQLIADDKVGRPVPNTARHIYFCIATSLDVQPDESITAA